MIYLNNIDRRQTVYIPRNDGGGYIHTGSSKSYEEGYADGIAHQKELLSTAAFTHNGEYERENGWSAVTVNVPQSGGSILEDKEIVVSQDVTVVTPDLGYDGFSAITVDATEYGQENYDSGFDDGFEDGYASGVTEGYESGYTSGSTDGYNSGYTSGETHQKSLLVSTAITQNGSYQRENGYSTITVNVPTGQTYNIEENHPFTATANGNYTITPTSATTLFRRGYEDGVDYFFTASTYPSVGYFEIGTILMEDNNNDFYDIIVFFNNGRFGFDATEWTDEGYHFYINQQSPNNEFYIGFDEDEYVYSNFSEGSGFTVAYDAMSAVSLTVNVPQTASTIPLSSITITGNTAITETEKAYSAITVNVQQTGHTDQELQDAFDDGYAEAFDDIENSAQTLSVSANGTYSTRLRDEGYLWNEVVVNVPQSGHTEQELQDSYNSGYTSGSTDVISTFSSMTATTNGVYGSSAHPLSSITVNVPQTGSSSGLTEFINRTITSVVIPNDCTLIGQYAFNGCRSLTSVTFHSGITIIGYNSFQYCVNLKEAIIPDSADVYDSAFASCTGMTAVTIGTGISYIRTRTFEKCYSLTDVVIPDSVEIIGEEAFYNCIRLDTITIGSGCTSIMHRAFLGCSGLSVINVNASTAPSLQTYVFANIPSTGTVHYPAGSDYSSWQNDAYLSGWTFIGDL